MESTIFKTNEELLNSSKKNFQLLQKIYNDNKEHCIPLIGAGLSNPTGINGWKQLLINMANQLTSLSTEEIEDALSKNEYLETASKIYNAVQNKKDYIKFLNNQFEQSSTLTTSTIIKTVMLFHSIVTTNYDTSIEEAHKTIEFITKNKQNFQKQSLPNLQASKLLQEKSIVYLHGYTTCETYLLKKEDYHLFYPTISKIDGSSNLENFLTSIITETNIIFMGFSFDDEYFCKFFKHAFNQYKVEKERINQQFSYQENIIESTHFAFIKLKKEDTKENPENTSLNNKLKELNIKPIYYEDSHLKLETEYLEKIKDYKEEVKLSTQGEFPNA